MSVEEYKQAGFPVSPYIQQAVIDRAEKDVQQAYLSPLSADIETQEEAREALMQLAFLLCLQRSIFATRSGAKEKQIPQSQTADRWNVLSEESTTCYLKMQRLALSLNVERWQRKVIDICGILFKSHFISL